ncbi:sigma-70 family RNA polymerase sigma factor [Paenibacillus xylanexedens]|uniref:sigma-70 family RNA polymerase sigma factor n=1 Tax=Paenibacillus xylanexedens TaxID=528191 RepID=UPI0011A7064D|nr:sigma-70 family RNA polymerase sigma factor [Paenibacillus xylanexedens]
MNFDNMLSYYDPNFDNEAMIRLAKETQSEELKEQVIKNNIRLVVKMANQWATKGSDEVDDLVSMGMIALINAFNKFDYTRGIKFVTYLCNAIWMEFSKNENKKKRKNRSKYVMVSIDNSKYKSSENGNDKSLAESLANDSHLEYENVDNDCFNRKLDAAISCRLTENEQKISRMYFLEGKELVDIGRELNVSRQAVHQAFKRSTQKLAPVFA